MSNEKQELKLAGWEAPLVAILIGGGIWTKYGQTIENWFFNNLGRIVFCGCGLLALCGYIIYYRIRKKNEEEINRLRRLSKVRPPERPVGSYYRRPNDQDLQ
jgi:hypothetical protein